MIFMSILLPIIGGIILLLIPEWKNRKVLCGYVLTFLILTGLFVLLTIITVSCHNPIIFLWLTKNLPVLFHVDTVGIFFAAITSIVWILTGIFSFSYMKHEKREKGYYGVYLIVYGVLNGLDFSGNLITFYGFYELMTLCSMPLVLHDRTKEAKMAGLKYLFFSFAGAYLVLFGLYILSANNAVLTFAAKGVLNTTQIQGKETLFLMAAFCMLLGFSVKAGLFPMHSWLPTAHPVAPAPASAALSGIIVKAGVLGCLRTVYYLFSPDFLKGTWVQETWLILILITILLGSFMAFREKAIKKRLAYSTVSQVSYILLGIGMLTPECFTGAILHTVAHAFMKSGLFLVAGVMIHESGKTRVDEFRGIGKVMPVTVICYTVLSLSLVGFPPFAGFVSKWYLGIGCVGAKIPIFGFLGPLVLIISALLTAGYLLPLSINGFFPGRNYNSDVNRKEVSLWMLIPILVLTLFVVLLGMFPTQLITLCNRISDTMIGR